MASEALARLSLNDQQAKEAQKKPKLLEAIELVVPDAHIDRNQASLLMSLATAQSKADVPGREYIVGAIMDDRLKSQTQLDAAVKFCATRKTPDDAAFDEACGVGITVTEDDVATVLKERVEKDRDLLLRDRYKALPTLLRDVRADERLRWANLAPLKGMVDSALLALLGPKDERDAPPKKVKKPVAAEKAAPTATSTVDTITNVFTTGFLGALHKVGENPQINESLRRAHLDAVNGKVHTRFPPEPNGYLHIGHAKAILVNFGFARQHDGVCYLRFDDTNPEKEEEKYFTAIEEIVSWLGFVPWKITYSSDYFQELYDLAEELIRRDKAYTCTCTDEQIKRNRGGEERGPRVACEHRSKPTEQSLAEFRDMRDRKYRPKSIILRMKQDLEDGNPQMWDLIAYRVLDTPHHRTADKWAIYPTYDFTHCLVDSMENITHSLCTTEFVQSRVSYEWLCDALEVYKPAQREYGRLALQGTVMSKRRIEKLVTGGYVRDWNDPRLYTLVALRRRGIPPGAILSFAGQLGVTTAVTQIQTSKLENVVRDYLEHSVPRLMMVLEPVLVELENVKEDFLEWCNVPFAAKDDSMGVHELPLTKRFFIDRSDFREEDSADFFRLAPGKTVGLLRAKYPVRAVAFERGQDGQVARITARYEHDVPFAKPQAYIQWVADAPAHGSPIRLSEVRCHGGLFKSDDPMSHPDGFLADINPDSEVVVRGALIERGYTEIARSAPWPKPVSRIEGKDDAKAPESVRFQAIRIGYFCQDSDSSPNSLVLNRIVTLKEDKAR
ncbi:Glutaminyl-tRNA synthetase [Savitreella phatthalungensis]